MYSKLGVQFSSESAHVMDRCAIYTNAHYIIINSAF